VNGEQATPAVRRPGQRSGPPRIIRGSVCAGRRRLSYWIAADLGWLSSSGSGWSSPQVLARYGASARSAQGTPHPRPHHDRQPV